MRWIGFHERHARIEDLAILTHAAGEHFAQVVARAESRPETAQHDDANRTVGAELR